MLERLTFGLDKEKRKIKENQMSPTTPSPPTRYFSIQPWESEAPPPRRRPQLQRGVGGLLTPVMTQGQESGCEKEPSTSRERVSSAWEPERAV